MGVTVVWAESGLLVEKTVKEDAEDESVDLGTFLTEEAATEAAAIWEYEQNNNSAPDEIYNSISGEEVEVVRQFSNARSCDYYTAQCIAAVSPIFAPFDPNAPPESIPQIIGYAVSGKNRASHTIREETIGSGNIA